VTERQPNNKIWVIVGLVCGLCCAVLLGFFAMGVYAGEKSVTLGEPIVVERKIPEPQPRPTSKSVVTIFIDAKDNISIDGVRIQDLSALKIKIREIAPEALDSTNFILRLSGKSSHKLLVSVKDILDETGAHSIIEIIRTENQ